MPHTFFLIPGYGAQGGYTQQPQGGYQPSQPPASDPWANGGSAPES